MRTQTPRPRGLWQSIRFAFAGFTLAATMLLLPSQGIEWIGEKAGADQTNTAPEPSGGTNGPIVAAYVYDKKGLSFPQSSATYLNQMNFSFALIQNGKVSGAHWQSIGAYQKFIAANPHIKSILSVGGWGADGFSQAASTAEGRKIFVQSALDLMEQYGFHGIDIDWEYPGSSAAGIKSSPSDKENFTLLLSDLRKGLDELTAKDGKPRMLAIAVGADLSLTGKIDCVAISKLVDQVNLMTYDMQQSSVSTHHTNLYSSNSQYPASVQSAVNAYVSAGIPRNKIMIGAAFYGRTFTTASTAGNGLYQENAQRVTKHYSYATIKSLVDNGESTRYYDEVAQAPYLFDGKTFISYDDPVSVALKGKYAKQGGLMGIMCWEYGDDANHELLQAMHEGIS